MIWDDSEENLLHFLDNLNKVHETVNYSIRFLYRTEKMKFEKDFLQSSGVQPFLWFRFLE